MASLVVNIGHRRKEKKRKRKERKRKEKEKIRKEKKKKRNWHSTTILTVIEMSHLFYLYFCTNISSIYIWQNQNCD
jgi:hypothetical protein